MDFGIAGKNAVICGSSSGIGFAIANCLVAEGVNVVINGRKLDKLESAKRKLAACKGGNVIGVVADISKQKDVYRLAADARNAFGSVDIFIYNTGGPKAGMYSGLNEYDWRIAYDEMFVPYIRLTRLFKGDMIDKKWGRIVNVTSIAVKEPIKNLVLSNTYRSAITALAKSMATEYADKRITINNVLPGYTDTERLRSLLSDMAKNQGRTMSEVTSDILKKVPMKRLVKPEELGAMVGFLCSTQASAITGQNFVVDCGAIKGV